MNKFSFLNSIKEEEIEQEEELLEVKKIEDGKYTEFYTAKELGCTCFRTAFPIKLHVDYKLKQKTGKAVHYFPNGQIQIKAEFKRDKKTGTWIFYNDKGFIIETIDFEDDLKKGNYKQYENNKLINHWIYDKNIKIKTIKGEINE